ncbi:CoA pyrophosphatase [Quadrisphaera sp. INWT6]|uniref:NUDIX hydrolase n=1 Tax=Quadrisphaera sp. INWT6 TaxID=2596917 RepID=UPI0019D53574|nr:CoA pyrophosphatase [Quadrisphaera sp. INWT6]
MSAPLPAWVERLAGELPAAGGAVAELLAGRAGAARAEGVPLGARSGRRAAVLVLLGPGDDGAGDVVLTERASGLRTHAGQVAFPGGGVDEADGGDPVRAALREAQEEAGVDPAGVAVVGRMPALVVPPTGTSVVPVLGWQAVPVPPVVGDPAEVARVLRVPLEALADPSARAVVRSPSGWTGPTFAVDGLVVWGFTAVLLDALLRAAGREQPWDARREVPMSSVTGAVAAAAPGARGRS